MPRKKPSARGRPEILMRSVEYKPEDRFVTAGEMRDALATHLERLLAGRVSYGVPSALD